MIPWDAIGEFIAGYNANEWDKEAVAVAVEKAVDEWYEEDKVWEIVGVEVEIAEPFPAKIDGIKRRDVYLVVWDWKTKRAGALDDVWATRETRSPQKKLYAAALASTYGPGVFPVHYEVRGIKLDAHKPLVKTLPSIITADEAQEALRHLQDQSAMRDTLIERKAYPWVKNPAGCRMFGPQYACRHEGRCWPPQALPCPETDEEAVSRVLSHSGAKTFLRCPELYRLDKSLKEESDRDEDTSVAGKLFHEVMERIYRGIGRK